MIFVDIGNDNGAIITLTRSCVQPNRYSITMTNLQYILYSIAAALIKAGESLRDSAENVPAGVGNGAPDEDGVVQHPENTSAAPAGGVDSAGLPWDERIHASTKTVKGDGTWTRRKGVQDTTYNAVVAELKARGHAASTSTATPGLPSLPAVGAAPASLLPPVAKLTKYQELCAYLAANTGPGKAADEAWVTAALGAQNTSLALLAAADEATNDAWLTAFKQALGA